MASQPTNAIYDNIISSTELARLMPDCVLLDCRAKLGDPQWGQQAFVDGHIPGAQQADLDQDLAAPPGAQGRHPLPERQIWRQTVAAWGIEPEQQVVLYDDAGGAYAARGWWMLRWLGHQAAAVLDGGIAHWQGPLQTGPANPASPSNYPQREALTRTIDSNTLLSKVQQSAPMQLIDARAEERFKGIQEPIDPVAGHIPGAVCLAFQGNLNDQGLFKPATELATRFASDSNSEDTICYCGSGVTAAHNILAMHIAGLPEPALYVNSWSGWITDSSRPIAT